VPGAPLGEYVLRTAEERGVRFVRLWFVDVLGLLKSIAIPFRSSSRRWTREWGSTAPHSRVVPAGANATRSPIPTRRRSRSCRGGRTRSLRGCSATSNCRMARRTPAIPAHALRRALAQAADLGLTFQVGRSRVLPVRGAGRRRGADAARRRRLLRPDAARRRQRLPAPDDRVPRAGRIRSRRRITSCRRPSTRSTSSTPTRCRWRMG